MEAADSCHFSGSVYQNEHEDTSVHVLMSSHSSLSLLSVQILLDNFRLDDMQVSSRSRTATISLLCTKFRYCVPYDRCTR
jgi:hypothetical protein